MPNTVDEEGAGRNPDEAKHQTASPFDQHQAGEVQDERLPAPAGHHMRPNRGDAERQEPDGQGRDTGKIAREPDEPEPESILGAIADPGRRADAGGDEPPGPQAPGASPLPCVEREQRRVVQGDCQVIGVGTRVPVYQPDNATAARRSHRSPSSTATGPPK